MTTRKIYGPPGTGKTTYLLSLMEKTLQSYAPEEIAFVSFTKRGAYEGAARARKKFGFQLSQMRYFRTLHSLCFSSIGAKKSQIMGKSDYKKFSDAVGMDFVGYYSPELEMYQGDNAYLFALLMRQANVHYCKKLIESLDEKKLLFVAANYLNFKKHFGLLDYADLLTEYEKRGTALPVKVAFVDEAQDLTPQQWRIVDKLFCNCDTVYIAGDDDQAIYEWNGADVSEFLRRGDETVVLSQSYRVPKQVHRLADTVLKLIDRRAEKVYRPRDKEGEVEHMPTWGAVKLGELQDDTLILCRNRYHMRQVEASLKEKGVPYIHRGVSSIDEKCFRAIYAFEEHRKTKTEETASKLQLYKDYFTIVDDAAPWYINANDTLLDAHYYRALLANGYNEKTIPNVTLNTIHASKGAEAAHVILSLDCSRKTYKSLIESPDSELRCYYVAITRAKEKLTVKLQETQNGYPVLWRDETHAF